MKTLQKKIFAIIKNEEDKSFAGEAFDWLMLGLIILNLLTLILDTFNTPPWYANIAFWVETITGVAFSIELLLRFWVAPLLYPTLPPIKARAKYITSFTAIIDLLAVLPLYLPLLLPVDLRVLRVFRLIRLIRLLKVNYYTDALFTLTRVFRKKSSQLIVSLLVIFMLIATASMLMYDLEHDAQPEVFKNAFSGLWWAMETITTVGNGDVTPITPIGRVLGAIIGLLGIGVVAVPTGIISAGFINVTNEGKSEPNSATSPALEIAAYKKLLDEGAISPKEYEAKKKSLLSL